MSIAVDADYGRIEQPESYDNGESLRVIARDLGVSPALLVKRAKEPV